MSRRPLVLALAFALLPATGAHAEDLLQTYQLARSGDPQLSAAESSRLATREGAVQARAAMLPQIDGDASYTSSRTDRHAAPSVVRQRGCALATTARTPRPSDLGLSLNQMVYDRASFTRLKSQKALSQASDFQLESAGDSLVTRTSQAYFNVLVAIESLAAAEAQETALKKQFDFASKRLEVGLAPITDVHEARAQYDSARANTIVARNALEDAYQAVAEITGQPVRNLKGLPDDFQPSLPSERDADGWVAAAIENNPALQGQAIPGAIGRSRCRDRARRHWPTLYFNGSYGDRRSDGSSTDNHRRLPDRFRATESKSRQHRADTAGSDFLRRRGVIAGAPGAGAARCRQPTNSSSRSAHWCATPATPTRPWSPASAKSRHGGLAVVSARSAYDASQVGLEVGTRTVLDVLTNQQNLFNAQREYAQSRYNFLQNRLLLEQAAGTLDIADVQDVNRLLTVDAEAQLAPGDIAQ